jgi:L-alanine-DL-glutamate epimerase-like enolase superfamily enzyme
MNMRIKELSTLRLSIPYVDEPRSDWVNQWGVQLYVKCNLEDTYGWGETLVAGSGVIEAYKHVIDDLISKLVVNADFQDINTLTSKLEKSLFTAGLCGIVAGAISGVELALWDAYARRMKMPLSSIIGSARRKTIPVYASFPRYSSINQLLTAVDKSLERGFTMVKLHQPPKTNLESIREIRSKYGGELRVALDLNAPFNVAHALDFLRSVSRYDPEWVEEPLWPPGDYDNLRVLTKGSEIPIALGENEYTLYGFRRMIEAGAAVIQPDITKVGGLQKFREIVELGKSLNVNVAPHLRPHRSALGLAFTLQAASAYPEITTIEYSLAPYPQDIFAGLGDIKGGKIDVPSGAGSGIQIQEDSLKKYSYQEMVRLLEFSDLTSR